MSREPIQPATLIRPIPDDKLQLRTWNASLNGGEIQTVRIIEITHPNFGTLAYGLTPSGYDGWAFHEIGGGGTVTLPFLIWEAILRVGVIKQKRPNQGGGVWNVPRGFIDLGETTAMAAIRELHEETGYSASPHRVFPLPGAKANPNSAFFETWGNEEGVGFFALEVLSEEAEQTDAGIVFRRDLLNLGDAAQHQRKEDIIENIRFIPWHDAACLGDMFSNAAVARLLAHLRTVGRSFK